MPGTLSRLSGAVVDRNQSVRILMNLSSLPTKKCVAREDSLRREYCVWLDASRGFWVDAIPSTHIPVGDGRWKRPAAMTAKPQAGAIPGESRDPPHPRNGFVITIRTRTTIGPAFCREDGVLVAMVAQR